MQIVNSRQKQPQLKPQDLLVLLKLAVNQQREYTFSELARELAMSASEVHAAVFRAELSRLITRENGKPEVIRSSLHEFLIHGVKYAFPPLMGAVTRGMLTGIAAPPLQEFFAGSSELPVVWPSPDGEFRGVSLLPFYHSAPAAARLDQNLYEVLVLVDALRAGAAREREIATAEIKARI